MTTDEINALLYADAQKASGIEVGDWVRLKEDVEPAKAGQIYNVQLAQNNGLWLADNFSRIGFRALYYQLEKVDYKTAQAECGLKVGDKVRVVRKAETHEKGWSDSWISPMYSLIGTENTIASIGLAGVGIRSNNSDFYFPFFVLEKVEANEEPVPEAESDCPFKPGDEVLVRDRCYQEWRKGILLNFKFGLPFPYYLKGGNVFRYCIPYAGNESLLGTSNSPGDAKKAPEADMPTTEATCPFKKGDLVLVRDSHVKTWIADRFESFDPSNEDGEFYITTFSLWSQCISFEGNQHLIGTAELPREEPSEEPKPEAAIKPGDLVLVRDGSSERWRADIFFKEDKGAGWPYRCIVRRWAEMIPYAGNEHLLD